MSAHLQTWIAIAVACALGVACSDADSTADGPGGDAGGEVEASPDGAAETDARATPTGCDPCGYGELRGRVCAPNEDVFVSGATVTLLDVVDCDGTPIELEVTSDAEGYYSFPEVPCGTHRIVIEKGSFRVEHPAPVVVGQVTDLTGAANKRCFSASSTPIAVLDGSWDDLEGILDALGLDYDLYEFGLAETAGSIDYLLTHPALMATYDIVLVNCGQEHAQIPPAAFDNLRAFVLGGGSLYGSDYAWIYGERAFPDAIEFMWTDDDTTSNDSPKAIAGHQTFTATVDDPALADYLGKGQLDIVFDLGPQIAPEAPGVGTTVHVTADIQQPAGSKPVVGEVPVVLSYRPAPDAGRVIYTNFHNDAQATEDITRLLYYLVFTL